MGDITHRGEGLGSSAAPIPTCDDGNTPRDFLVAQWDEVADEVIAAISARVPALLKKATDDLYSDLLYSTQEYLEQNVRFNIVATVSAANRQAQRDRERAISMKAQRDHLYGPLKRLVEVIESAGVHNLSNGVQLGQVSWSVKANDAVEWAKRASEHCRTVSTEPWDTLGGYDDGAAGGMNP